MKALVTGANGLIGANLLRALIAEGAHPTGLVRATSDTSGVDCLPAGLVVGDVLDRPGLAAAMAGCDVVFHTAVAFSYWGEDLADMARTAVEGSLNVLAAAAEAGVRRVVVTSSSVTLGAAYDREVRDESSCLAPVGDEATYIQAKIDQERETLAAARRLNIEAVFACPTMSLGPFGVGLGPSNGIVANYLADPLRMTWDGGCNIVSVRDVAAGHLILARRGVAGERYVLGSENLEWRRAHAMIAELAGIAGPRLQAGALVGYGAAIAAELQSRLTGQAPLATRAQARMIGRYYWYSHARAAALGYRPRPAREAVCEALAWLSPSRHVSREARASMRLAREVHVARRAIAADEARLVSGAAA